MKAVVEEVGGCCSTGAESKTCQLFSFGRNSFRINASYDNESRKNSSSNNTNYNRESRHYCYCFGDCYSTGTLNLKHGNPFVKNSFNDNANFDKEHDVVLEAVVQLKLKQ
uniref:TLDc domain-containing protein n=1 Tax=Strongyloides stercoralis TaxID=6248 RepID=A0A0K0E5L6_STRER